MKAKTISDFFEPDCPYANNCKSKGVRCGSCRNNRRKEDHYEPSEPYIWPKPWGPMRYSCTDSGKRRPVMRRDGSVYWVINND